MTKAWYDKNKETILKKLKDKYQEDREFREKAKATYRTKYQKDKAYHDKTLQRSKDRYHSDENYKQATINRVKQSREKKKIEAQNKNNPKRLDE